MKDSKKEKKEKKERDIVEKETKILEEPGLLEGVQINQPQDIPLINGHDEQIGVNQPNNHKNE